MDPSRIRHLNENAEQRGDYVLYWMQASQRTQFNHALEYAIERANCAKLPLIVCFGLMDDYPEANARHYAFMLEGLRDVQIVLKKRGVAFVVKHGRPVDVAIDLAKRAALVVCDRGYLRHQRGWRDEVADGCACEVVEIESDVVVPVEVASEKAEFAARTIRPKIQRALNAYLKPVRHSRLAVPLAGRFPRSAHKDIDVSDPEVALAQLKVDRSVAPSTRFTGGEIAAGKLLREFLKKRLKGYDEGRNEPAAGHTSHLSPYLHFGQISPIEIALHVRERGNGSEDALAYLEELIVRRELAINFAQFNPKYDSYDGLPEWARRTLAEHRNDKRAYVYSREQLERAQTHDPYWNAAQREMTRSGCMHNYMRMYWGKKIIEWKRSAQEAYSDALYLNNKYFLDGRDPNAYTNVGWLFGLHDRPWGEREIFGKVRYMNAAGLERKFDMARYVEWVEQLP